MAAVTSSVSTSGHLADTVKAATDAEDIVPLIRVVFDAVTASLNSYTTKQALLTRTPHAVTTLDPLQEEEEEESSVPAGRRASDRLKASRKAVAAPVINLLEKIVKDRSAELAQICRGNAEEIVSSLQELEAMQEGADELQKRISEGDAVLRKAGTSFVNGLEQLQDLRRIESSVAASCRAVSSAKQLVQLCAQAGRAVTNNELYIAFCLLKRAQTEFLGETAESYQNEARKALGKDDSNQRQLSRDVRLHAFLSGRVQEMQAAIQQKAVADFNAWLVTARSEARGVGMLAFRKAAWERQREESLLQMRKKLASELSNISDPEQAAIQLAKPLPTRFAGQAKLNPGQQPAAAALMEDGPVDPNLDFLASIDMTQLHRCVHLHECLGKVQDFQAYYQYNRRMQLNNDLSAQNTFLQQYKGYLAQLVGYFVIEERVRRVSHALSGGEMNSGWETAIAYLKLAMETAFETIATASLALEIKDFVLLSCSALENLGYHVAPLYDLLMSARPKYHQLLAAAFVPDFEKCVAECSSVPCTIATASQAAEMSALLGLPLTNGGSTTGLGPTPPFEAPFSEMVPQLLYMLRKYIEDCAAFKWGLISSGELLPMVRAQRDSFLLQTPLQLIEDAIVAMPSSHPLALTLALQTIADIDALSAALQALDDHTHLVVRGTSSRDRSDRLARSTSDVIGPAISLQRDSLGVGSDAESNPASPSARMLASQTKICSAGLTAKLVELLRVAEGKVSEVLTHRAREVVRQSAPPDWTPETPVHSGGAPSQYVLSLLDFMKAAQRKISSVISTRSYHHIISNIMRSIGDILMGLLLADETPAYNLYGLFRFHSDLMSLNEFATQSGIPGMEVGLHEAIQFCDLMVTGRLEEILDGQKRAALYPAIDLQHLFTLLKKFREVPGKSGPGSSYSFLRAKQPESFLKKKTADKVSKQIRTQLEYAGYTFLPK